VVCFILRQTYDLSDINCEIGSIRLPFGNLMLPKTRGKLILPYLDMRFQKEILWERRGEKFNAIWLSDWSEIFDDWMLYQRGVIPKSRISL
jgi:P2-related tail formation protein